MNQTNNYSLCEEEQLKVQQAKINVAKFIYGQVGLLTFLDHLFGKLSEKQCKDVNYYFSIKEQLKALDKTQKQNAKEGKTNIIEEDPDDEEEKDSATLNKKLPYSP